MAYDDLTFRVRSLAQKAQGCHLIKYPVYVDIDSGEFIRAEDMVSIMERQGPDVSLAAESAWRTRALQKVGNIVRGLRYAP